MPEATIRVPPRTADPAGNDAGRPTKTRLVFVDICRSIGAILVVYSHLTEHWSRQHDHSDNGAHSPVIDVLNMLLRDPLHLQRQGLGQIAVPVFFLISGFVVTPIALKQGQLKFTVNRALRIYPALMFVVLLTAGVLLLGMDPLSGGEIRTVTALSVLTNLLLVNYLLIPQVVFVGVAWTLIVEVVFYVLLIAMLPLFRRFLAVALGIELAFVLGVLLTAKQFGDSYFLFAVAVSYIPIILLGQIIWAAYHRKIPLWLAGSYLAAAWALYVTADLLKMGRLDTSYNLALAYAVLLFLLGLFAEDRLKQYRAWTELSERTYSIYLIHGLVAFPVLTALSGALPFELSALIAIIATGLAVEICYRLVEKPSHQLARRLTRRKPEPPGQPTSPPPGAAPPPARAATSWPPLWDGRSRSSDPFDQPGARRTPEPPAVPPAPPGLPTGTPAGGPSRPPVGLPSSGSSQVHQPGGPSIGRPAVNLLGPAPVGRQPAGQQPAGQQPAGQPPVGQSAAERRALQEPRPGSPPSDGGGRRAAGNIASAFGVARSRAAGAPRAAADQPPTDDAPRVRPYAPPISAPQARIVRPAKDI